MKKYIELEYYGGLLSESFDDNSLPQPWEFKRFSPPNFVDPSSKFAYSHYYENDDGYLKIYTIENDAAFRIIGLYRELSGWNGDVADNYFLAKFKNVNLQDSKGVRIMFQIKNYQGTKTFPYVRIVKKTTSDNNWLYFYSYSDVNNYTWSSYCFDKSTDFPTEYNILFFFNDSQHKIEMYVNFGNWKETMTQNAGNSYNDTLITPYGVFKKYVECSYYYYPITSYDSVFIGGELMYTGDSFEIHDFSVIYDKYSSINTTVIDLTSIGHIEKFYFINKNENKVDFEKVKGRALKNLYRQKWVYEYSLLSDADTITNLLKSLKNNKYKSIKLFSNDADKTDVRFTELSLINIKRNVFKKTILNFESNNIFLAPIIETSISFTDKKIELRNIIMNSGDSLELKIYNDVDTYQLKVYSSFTGSIMANNVALKNNDITNVDADNGIQTITITSNAESKIETLTITGV